MQSLRAWQSLSSLCDDPFQLYCDIITVTDNRQSWGMTELNTCMKITVDFKLYQLYELGFQKQKAAEHSNLCCDSR